MCNHRPFFANGNNSFVINRRTKTGKTPVYFYRRRIFRNRVPNYRIRLRRFSRNEHNIVLRSRAYRLNSIRTVSLPVGIRKQRSVSGGVNINSRSTSFRQNWRALCRLLSHRTAYQLFLRVYSSVFSPLSRRNERVAYRRVHGYRNYKTSRTGLLAEFRVNAFRARSRGPVIVPPFLTVNAVFGKVNHRLDGNPHSVFV